MDMTLEVVTVPVTDIDRAKDFYVNKLGFHADMDLQVSASMRFVQLTPPGSNCSIHFTVDTSAMQPGSLKGVFLVVDSAAAAKAELEANGVTLSDIDKQPWGEHVYFSDPDGNSWILQESYTRNKLKAEQQQK